MPESDLICYTEFERLLRTLEEQKIFCEKMILLLKRKQTTIINNQVEELRLCMQDEQNLMQLIKTAVERLQEIRLDLSEYLKLPPQTTALSDLVHLAPFPLRLKIQNLQLHLRTLIEKMAKINHENRHLLNYSIEFIRGMVQLFLKPGDETNRIYDPRGMIALPQNGTKVVNFQI